MRKKSRSLIESGSDDDGLDGGDAEGESLIVSDREDHRRDDGGGDAEVRAEMLLPMPANCVSRSIARSKPAIAIARAWLRMQRR